jgi:hypothetical protein
MSEMNKQFDLTSVGSMKARPGKKQYPVAQFFTANQPSFAAAVFPRTTAASQWSDGLVIQSRNGNSVINRINQ